MKDFFVGMRNSIIAVFYRFLLKPVFFKMDPENIHDIMVGTGKNLGRFALMRWSTRVMFGYRHKMLEQHILGMHFRNPVGLAAGFDKNALLTKILPSVGFGFEEVGSITGEPCAGNPKPRLWRLPKSKSLVVHYGLMNDGAEVIAKRLKNLAFAFPVGTSIAKTNSPDTCETDAGVRDYVKGFRFFTDIGDYYTVNISCPNAYGGQPFTDPAKLENLLEALDKIQTRKPVFLKFSPDITSQNLDEILEVASRHRIHGFICTNLTKNRNNSKIKDENVPEKGGLSGKVVEDLSNAMIAHIYRKTKGKYVIIGCGGVFTAHDAYVKIRSGASLIQMITGMIYQGPQTISAVNLGLVRLLKRDGFASVREAIGVDVQ
ncbi:MAG: quinone-dependent dihydroorotate dehydrogenase [Candidatus Gracilibacteria bacterium]